MATATTKPSRVYIDDVRTLGTFQVNSSVIRAADPWYSLDTAGVGFVHAMPGIWDCSIGCFADGNILVIRNRASGIADLFADADRWTPEFSIGVDTGRFGFFDVIEGETFRQEFSEDTYGPYSSGHGGVAIHNGYGDGTFECWSIRQSEGDGYQSRAVALMLGWDGGVVINEADELPL